MFFFQIFSTSTCKFETTMKISKNIYRIRRYSAVILFYFFKLSFLDEDRGRYYIVILCLFIRVVGFR